MTTATDTFAAFPATLATARGAGETSYSRYPCAFRFATPMDLRHTAA